LLLEHASAVQLLLMGLALLKQLHLLGLWQLLLLPQLVMLLLTVTVDAQHQRRVICSG
jgi:hypothetical protein